MVQLTDHAGGTCRVKKKKITVDYIYNSFDMNTYSNKSHGK